MGWSYLIVSICISLPGELSEILQKRCAIAPSHSDLMVQILIDLQRRRTKTSIFDGKKGKFTLLYSGSTTAMHCCIHCLCALEPLLLTLLLWSLVSGFITPRDLFRWAERKPISKADIATEGFMLLGERLRSADQKAILKEVCTQSDT